MNATSEPQATVLVVDDTPEAISLVRMSLEEAGFGVSVATTGEKAIQRADLVAPDLILLDILMPGMDGYETCRRLKAQPSTREIPIIFLSGLTETFDKVKAFQLGAVDYLIKPLATEELLVRVETHLTLNRLTKELQAANRHLEERVALRTQDLARANRGLRMLSDFNQLVVRAAEEATLLEEGCRIIVELGGYQVAWVGFTEPEPARRVRPVAVRGLQPNCLETVDSSWTEIEIGAGPTGLAIRTGQACITEDIRTAPYFAPWREESERRGYGASICLPLCGEGCVFGVLTIYAAEPNAFGDTERELLRELAGDLAYSITSLRVAADRRRAVEALRASEERYRALYRDNPSMLFTLDAEGLIISVNEFGANQLGYSIEELEGQPVLPVFYEPDRAAVAAQLRECLRHAGRVYRWQLRKTHKDGSILWVEEFARAVADPNGAIRVLVVCQDVTERKQAEENKAKLEAQLRQVQKLEAIGTLASGIAHDFNNILSAIFSYTELACMDAAGNPEVLNSLTQVFKASERAKDLVRQILAFTRQTKPERKPLRLHPAINEALALLRSTLPTTIEIRGTIQADTPVVLADPTQVHQVLMNLCTNAAHAMRGATGRLTVNLDSLVVDSALAQSVPDLRLGRHATLEVSDTGHGMDAETLKRMFEPFFTTKAPGEGTGLGLAVVHGIVKDHQGAIAVESQPGVGTTFRLFFPACEAQESADLKPAEPPRGHGEHILFVDDESIICVLAQNILERLGYRVTTYHQPRRALEAFRLAPENFSLLVTDLTMPDITGIDLAVQIQQIRRGIPIIIATGYSGALTSEMATSAGIREVLQKPITISSLGEVVHEALRDTAGA